MIEYYGLNLNLFLFCQIKKALELYEQLCQRMGVVIVGPSGAGKSTLWRMLRAALSKIGKVVKQYTMNPKAMPRHQLLGHIDMDTREWSDGVLTNSARQVVREPQGWSLLYNSLFSVVILRQQYIMLSYQHLYITIKCLMLMYF